jgi:hypothetical protein
MSKTIAQLEVDLSRKLHGTNLNFVEGKYSLYEEASRECLKDIDFFETKRIQQITNAVYSDVYDYALPADLKGNAIIDIRPQVNRKQNELPIRNTGMEFDLRKGTQKFTIKDNSGVRLLRFNSGLNTSVLLNACDSLTNNGTWVVGDDATNLTLDTLNYISGNGSLNFDVSGVGTTASIYNITMNEVDLSELEDRDPVFLWVYMPVVITNATLIWGEDITAKYWTKTITTSQTGAFQVGWNLLRFDWNGATKVGLPDSSKVKALKLSFTYDGNVDTDYRLDNIIVPRGTIYEIEYYSKYLFTTTAGVYQDTVTLNTDIITLDEGYNCFLYKCIELIAPQVHAEDAGFDYNLYNKQYLIETASYKNKYKSEIRPLVTNYYRKV